MTESSPDSRDDAVVDISPISANSDSEDNKPRGHGRNSHEVYTNAIEHNLRVNDLSVGSLCPAACSGKLYQYQPGVLVRIKGQDWASVHKYYTEKLRCNLCGELISASIPDDISNDKYDASFKASLAIQKYYIAVPFNRQAYFQLLMNMPLPSATQWDLINDLATSVIPVFNALEDIAANGDIIHADDSSIKLLDVMKDNFNNPHKKRTGMFTTAILSKVDNHEIALFYNSQYHAGEVSNLIDAANSVCSKRSSPTLALLKERGTSSRKSPARAKVKKVDFSVTA